MKVFAVCMTCQIELGHPSFEPFLLPYFDDRLAKIKCARGHESILVIQSQKFEILMESGADALLSGFTLEACASFSSALERVYEFCIRVFMINKKIDGEQFTKMFKEMSRQSERQLGAFMALYLTEIGEAYQPDQSLTTFRNSVIHKGEIPSEDKAFEYCSKVYETIIKICDLLKINFPSSVNEAIRKDMEERMKNIPKEMNKTISSSTSLFDLGRVDNKRTLGEALENKKLAKQMLEGSMSVMQQISDLINTLPPINKCP